MKLPYFLHVGLSVFVLSLCAIGRTQTQTVGTLLNTPESFNGYTLLDPMGSTTTYLINNCGEVVNTWSGEHDAGGSCYLLDDGSLIRGCKVSGAFSGGGTGGRIERRSWDNELVWALDWADDEKHHHHDFAWMPNGHVLVLAWELKTAAQAEEVGRINPQTMWPESVTEIAPTMPSGGEVVWEWHAWDHLVQDADPALPSFGSPSEFPQRINVNFANVGGGGGPGGANSGDWMHANAVNYNAELDQIAISSRRFNEIWVIDHSTTSEEAAGPAGDLKYRYGNPEAYGRGTALDRVFFGQHDVQWIPEGHPQAGQFLIYNNGDGRPDCMCSSIDVWSPPLGSDGNYDLSKSAPFGPENLSWSYPQTLSSAFFSPNISGVQPQPNGNYLVCEGANGRLFEVTQDGDLVWDYINPEGNFGVVPQGTSPQQNSVFRAYRYSPSFPGFDGKDMTPSDPLEGPHEYACELFDNPSSTWESQNGSSQATSLHAFPNPTNGLLSVSFPSEGRWELTSVEGKTVLSGATSFAQVGEIDLSALKPGMWMLHFHNHHLSHTLRIVRID